MRRVASMRSKRLANVDFPAEGKYTVHLYHYNDTAIDKIYFEEVNDSLDTEIIVIEE